MLRDESGNQFYYDAWDRLVEVKNSGGVTQVRYAYDAHGRRTARTAGGTTTDLYYDGWRLIEEREGGVVKAQYVWAVDYVDSLVLRDRDAAAGGDLGKAGSGLDERLFVQQDANYNVTALTDTSGAVVERYLYDPYGNQDYRNADGSDKSSSGYSWFFMYKGGRQNFGLYHFRSRDYSPTLMRWVQADKGYFDGLNLYEAYRSSPGNHVDPMGLWSWDRFYQAVGASPAGLVAELAMPGDGGREWGRGATQGAMNYANAATQQAAGLALSGTHGARAERALRRAGVDPYADWSRGAVYDEPESVHRWSMRSAHTSLFFLSLASGRPTVDGVASGLRTAWGVVNRSWRAAASRARSAASGVRQFWDRYCRRSPGANGGGGASSGGAPSPTPASSTPASPTPPPGAAASTGTLTRGQRLTEYFNRLRGQPASRNANEALGRVSRTLDEVEDALSGIPRQTPPPPPNMPDGRMYPPQADNITCNPNGSISARTAGHRVEIGADGSITITNRRSGAIDFHQPGAGGGS